MSLQPTQARANFSEAVSSREEQFLSSLAVRSYPARRELPEDDALYRTPFQRDRDRIVHSKSFRRLKHKTQVFVAPEGDHIRTRLTHTLETTGIARTVARALALNEDLTEAIGLGHDLGHPPFGHAGEEVLSACLEERYGTGFAHNMHSLRVVERLERGGRGLNLTEQVRDGILNHTGPERPATLEGRILRLVDRIAYINHDIDDAVRAGVLGVAELPRAEIKLLGATGSDRIDLLVGDLIDQSQRAGDIVQSEEIGAAMLRLRKFMFQHVYLGPAVRAEHDRIERLVRGLFGHYIDNPGAILDYESSTGGEPSSPEATQPGIPPDAQRVADWIAGMTDRFAIRVYQELTVPRASSA